MKKVQNINDQSSKLSEDVQAFIVTALACYRYPSEVVEMVKEQFDGLTLARQQVQYYDPTKGDKGKRLAERWRVLFDKTRATFKTAVDAHGISHLSYRLERLQRYAVKLEQGGEYVQAAQMLEQAAKDFGGTFTNKRKIELSPREALAASLGLSGDELPDDLSEISHLIQ